MRYEVPAFAGMTSLLGGDGGDSSLRWNRFSSLLIPKIYRDKKNEEKLYIIYNTVLSCDSSEGWNLLITKKNVIPAKAGTSRLLNNDIERKPVACTSHSYAFYIIPVMRSSKAGLSAPMENSSG